MTPIQPYYLPHLQDYPIFIALYRDVQNADLLRQQLLDGNTDFEYAFLDATRVRTVLIPKFPLSLPSHGCTRHQSECEDCGYPKHNLEGRYMQTYGANTSHRKILSTTQIYAATFRAINDMLNTRLKSRNVHSEIVFCLSANNNVRSSLGSRDFYDLPLCAAYQKSGWSMEY